MIIRVIFVCLLAIFISACDLFRADKCGTFADNRADEGMTSAGPIAPTTIYCGEVQNINQSQNQSQDGSDNVDKDDDIDDNDDDDDDDDSGKLPAVTATITVSHTNDSGRTVYRIGPGSSFTRVSGSADTVWCRTGSDCNGDNRTEINVTSPPSIWVSDKHAEFRRSGSDGSDVMFNVDDQMISHSFRVNNDE